MGLDSVELIMSIEKHFDILYPDKEIQQANTIEELTLLTAKIIKVDNPIKPEFDAVYNLLKSYWNDDIKLYHLVNQYIKINGVNIMAREVELKIPNHSSLSFNQLKSWLNYYFIKWENLTVEDFINAIIIANPNQFFTELIPNTIYGIYITIARIIEDRIGCPIYDLQPRVHIFNELGID